MGDIISGEVLRPLLKKELHRLNLLENILTNDLDMSDALIPSFIVGMANIQTIESLLPQSTLLPSHRRSVLNLSTVIKEPKMCAEYGLQILLAFRMVAQGDISQEGISNIMEKYCAKYIRTVEKKKHL